MELGFFIIPTYLISQEEAVLIDNMPLTFTSYIIKAMESFPFYRDWVSNMHWIPCGFHAGDQM